MAATRLALHPPTFSGYAKNLHGYANTCINNKVQFEQTQDLYQKLFEQSQVNHEGKLQLFFNPHAKKAQNKRALIRWLKTLKQAHTSTSDDSIWEDQILATTLLGKNLAKLIPQGRWLTLYPCIAATLLFSVLLGALLQQGWQRYGDTE